VSPRSIRLFPVLPALALVACTPPASTAAPTTTSAVSTAAVPEAAASLAPAASRWLALVLADQPVGRAREEVSHVAGGGVATRAASEIRIARLGKVVEMTTDFTLTEDAQGQLRAVRGETRLSRQLMTSEVAFAGGTATIRESAGGASHARSVAVSEPLLGPEAIRRLVAAKLRAAGDSVAYTTWSPARSAPQRVQCTAEQLDAVTIDGAPAQLLRVKIVAEGEAAPRTAWFDASGRERRSELLLPFGVMVATEVATEPAMPGGELGADVFARTLIRSNVRLPGPRALDRLRVRVELDDPAAAMPVVGGDDQRVVGREGRATVIEIDRAEPPAPGPSAPGDVVGPEYLAASAIVDPSEPSVRAIAAEATVGAADPWAKAQRLTRWVAEHMTFDAGIAFAPAAELARDRHGTCAGYAVLLASLLRAAGIPARVDMGLVYAGGIFGGHAWVEARIDRRWVPLDAALPSDGPADAARIALDRGPLDAGPGAMVTAFGQVIGHAKIRVVGYAAHGRPLIRVDPAAAPYTVDGARYTNPGLGLSITAPRGYRFTDMDAVWPERTVVALDGDGGGPGGRVTLSELPLPLGGDPAHPEAAALDVAATACERAAIAGRPACAIRRDGAARLAFRDGASMFVLEARGPAARSLLDAVAGAVRLAPR